MDTKVTFKPGDKVRRLNGISFSNGEYVATVSSETNSTVVWLEETGTHTLPSGLVHDSDVVHNPPGGSTEYYLFPPEASQLQDLIEYRQMNFSVGNIFKACYRLGEKSGTDQLYDINKIIWFAEREKERLEAGME